MSSSIDLESLERMIGDGDIDTILCVFSDMQGRFMGKLVTVDMEMEPLPGYEYANWETGYGDFRMVPDLATLRLIPWLEKTALVICDVHDEETDEPVEVAPRQIL